MRLPEDDEDFLNRKGYQWAIFPEGNGACLVISKYGLAPRYSPGEIDLMIRIPAQYNIAGLDMFYVDPPVQFKATGSFPQAAEVFENYCGRRWQRFSRHLQQPWRAGVDGLPMFLAIIERELRT